MSLPAENQLPAAKVMRFQVRCSEAGRDGVLKLRPVFDLAQEIAANHAEELGMGMMELKRCQLGWMLSRERFAFPGPMPRLGDVIELETYPRGVDKLFALREFVFRNASGTVFAYGSSCWIVVDLKRMRPVDPRCVLGENFPGNEDRELFFPGLRKLAMPETLEPWGERAVPESGIDVNGHWNNAEYAALVQDLLHAKRRSFAEVRELQINFLHGVAADSVVRCSGMMDETRFLCRSVSGDCEVFQAEGFWI